MARGRNRRDGLLNGLVACLVDLVGSELRLPYLYVYGLMALSDKCCLTVILRSPFLSVSFGLVELQHDHFSLCIDRRDKSLYFRNVIGHRSAAV